MTTPLIHTQQRWLPRAVDVALTVLAWTVFVYLFFTGFLAVIQERAQPGAHLHFGLLFATIDTLLFYLLIGAANATILALWAKYNEIRRSGGERRAAIPALDDQQLMTSFDLPPHMLEIFRRHQVVTVFNDDHGRISEVTAAPSDAASGTVGETAFADRDPMPRASAPAPLSETGREAAFRAKPAFRP